MPNPLNPISRSIASFAALAMVGMLTACASSSTAAAGRSPAAAVPPPSGAASATSSTGSDDSGLATFPSAAPGGSAIQVTGPCDSGTMTLVARPDGAGVATTATLSHVAHDKWQGDLSVTPYLDQGGPDDLSPYTAHDGDLVISATNLKGPGAGRKGVNYAWPQFAQAQFIRITSTYPPPCDEGVYMTSNRAIGQTHDAALNFSATGLITIHSFDAEPDTWRITLDSWSAAGMQSQTKDVAAAGSSGACCTLDTTMNGLPASDVTKATLTISKQDGSHSTWLTITRTP